MISHTEMTRTKATFSRRRPSLKVAMSVLLAAFLALVVTAGSATAEPNQTAFTTTGARFWTWVLTQPAATNPLTDTSGQFCSRGQAGNTWFLAGTLSSDPVSRTCTVPTGKKVVFPVVNNAYFAFFNDPPEQRTETFVRSQVAFVKDAATAMRVSLDGRTLAAKHIRYEQSRLFSLTLPADNLLGLPAGFLLDPCVDAGYYVHLHPLKPGHHALHFHGELPGGVTVDVTYQLTVGR